MSKIKWFSTWFDSPYYHILYDQRDEQEASAFIKAIQKKLNFPLNSKVLDAACGKGRHAITLQELGFDVQGFDLSPKNIKEAKRFSEKNLSFFVHDIRDSLPLGEAYDLVFNFFTSFGYFDAKSDNQASFNSLSAALKQGGIFLMDFFNPKYVLNNLVGQEIVIKQGIDFKISRWAENGFLYKSIDFMDQNIEYHFEEKVELISNSDFMDYAMKSGFKLLDILGDYQLNSFNDQKSPRMIFLWIKK
jgi:SAM-dependent methyltransferase